MQASLLSSLVNIGRLGRVVEECWVMAISVVVSYHGEELKKVGEVHGVRSSFKGQSLSLSLSLTLSL